MERDLYWTLKDKGYACNMICKCKIHQIVSLRIKEYLIPSLKTNKRIGVIRKLATKDKKLESEEKNLIEKSKLKQLF